MLVKEAELLPCVAIHGWSGALRLPWTMKPCLIWALVRAELLDGYSCSSLWMSMKYEDEATHSLLQQLLLFLPPALQSRLSTRASPPHNLTYLRLRAAFSDSFVACFFAST